MRLVTYQSIFDGVVRRMGLDASGDDISTDTGMAIAEKVTQRIKSVLDIWDWSEFSRTEERAYRSIWNDVRTFRIVGEDGNPDEFYYLADQTYYRVLATAPGDPPAGTLPTNTTYFESFNNPEPFIARDQIDQMSMGTVLGVYGRNPSLNGSSNGDRLLSFRPSERGIEVLGVYNFSPWWIAPNPPQSASPLTAFVWYLIPPPEYTWKPYIDIRQYHAGDLVFFAPPTGDGNCYKALGDTVGNAPTNINFWVIEPVPASLATFLKEGAYADLLSDGINGEPATAAALQASGLAETKAQASIQREIDKLLSQGQKHFYGGAKQWRWSGLWSSQPWGGDKVITLGGPVPSSGVLPTPAGIGAPWEFRREIISILGSTLSLQALSTTARQSGSMVTIVIGSSGNRDKSTWQLLSGAAIPGDDGQVQPLDYSPSTNKVHWELVGD